MAIKERMSGNEAVSYAIRQINPDAGISNYSFDGDSTDGFYLYCKW